MSSASSSARSGDIIYGDPSASDKSNPLAIVAAVIVGLVVIVMLFKKDK